ncbi:MAG TPA: TetR/AcrR family transcriptional regulator [Candidatus Polarisedimenticolaceae bacterium]|nr:TetR/AcrR family transcriptional regulator [Candidatus Polarisedimenticolaceae bacterium]
MNNAAPSVRNGDRRVRRTQRALTRALVDLVLEKRYDAITIQNLLDRADVGRSTFYAHYRGKDDLLLRSFERMLDMFDGAIERDPTPSRRVAPVRELFEHVGEVRPFQQALARARVLDRQYQVGIEQMSRTIERRLASSFRSDPIPAAVRARALAGSLFALLRWWIDQDAPYSPEEMDRMFHAMVAS